MKKVLAITIIIIAVFISCKKTTTTSTGVTEITPSDPKQVEEVKPSGDECYLLTANNNTTTLNFNINSNQEVNGTLSYSLYGKDKNDGTINGNMVGDTLIAEYTFDSEGVSSVREVVFLQKDDGSYVEGHGDVTELNDRIVFKDRKKLKFDTINILTKVDCKVN